MSQVPVVIWDYRIGREDLRKGFAMLEWRRGGAFSLNSTTSAISTDATNLGPYQDE